jgi:hypothetical protein
MGGCDSMFLVFIGRPAFGNIQNRNIGPPVFVTKTADSAGSRRKRRIRRRRYNRRRVREGDEDQADAAGIPKSFEPAPQRGLRRTRCSNLVQKISRRWLTAKKFSRPRKLFTYPFQRPSRFPWILGEMLGYQGTCY